MNNIPPVPSILRNKLIDMEIKTVEQLLHINAEGFEKRRSVGKKSLRAFVEFKSQVQSVIAELNNYDEVGNINLNYTGCYIDKCQNLEKQLILPAEFDSELSQEPLYMMIAFEHALDELINLVEGQKPRDYSIREVVEGYYGLNRKPSLPVDEIGRNIGKSSERVRQIIVENVAAFQSLLTGSSFLNVVLHDDLKNLITDVECRLRGDRVFDLKRLYSLLGFEGESGANVTESFISFLLDVLEVKIGSTARFNRTDGNFFFIGNDQNELQAEFAFICKKLIEVLNEPGTELSESESIKIVRKERSTIDPELIRKALLLLPEIEFSEDVGRYRIRFEKLTKGQSRAYRVLSDKGEPMHIDEILQEVHHRLSLVGVIKSYTRASLQLPTNSAFFRARGKTGIWGLVEWPDWDAIATATIDEIIKMIFNLKKRPLKLEELYLAVSSLRADIRRDAVNARCSDLCLKLDYGMLILNEWKAIPHFKNAINTSRQKVQNPVIVRSSKTKNICSMMIEFLEKQPDKLALSVDIAAHVLSKYKDSKPLLYKLFREEKYLSKEKNESGKLMIRLRDGFNSKNALQ